MQYGKQTVKTVITKRKEAEGEGATEWDTALQGPITEL